MPFHIKNPETDALARRFAASRKIGLTDAVHLALSEAVARDSARPSLAELAAGFCRELRREAAAANGAAERNEPVLGER